MTKNTTITFESLQLIQPIQKALSSEGYTHPTPIQAQAIPLILDKRDLFGIAQTGTGKTAAFTIPILQMLASHTHAEKGRKPIKCLILTPTRELASQIGESIANYGKHLKSNHTVIFGGVNQFSQVNAIRAGVEILIATPGRLLDLINQRIVILKDVQYLVLDEADRMLDMGFFDDIMFVIKHLPPKRQNLLFSATMPVKIRDLARKILHQPVEINIAISKPPDQIVQKVFFIYETQKIPLVAHLLKEGKQTDVLIFCSSKLSVKQLTRELKRLRFNADEIHSDLEQDQREEVLSRFRSGKLGILVATDILSRGIDIDSIELVINFDVPHDGEDYVHRIGRTARAKAEGSAFTLVTPQEQYKFSGIEKLMELKVPVGLVPEELGETPVYDPAAFKKKSGKKTFYRKK